MERTWSVNGRTVGRKDGGSHERADRHVDGQQTTLSRSNTRSLGRSVGRFVGRACVRTVGQTDGTDVTDGRSDGRTRGQMDGQVADVSVVLLSDDLQMSMVCSFFCAACAALLCSHSRTERRELKTCRLLRSQ